MARKPPKKITCAYNKCALPDNNRYYIWQCIVLITAFFAFMAMKTEITSLNIALFIVPVMLDLFDTKLYNKVLVVVAFIIRWLDVITIILIILNLFGIIYQKDNLYQITLEYVGTKYIPLKGWMLSVAAINILVPIILGIGRPTKRTIEILNTAQSLDSKSKE